MIRVGFLLLLCTGAFAQFYGFVGCPDRKTVPNFNLTRYMKTWYEIEKHITFETWKEKCLTCRYETKKDGSITISHMLTNLETKNIVKFHGDARFAGAKTEAKFIVDYPRSQNTKHYILDTDYESYSVVFSCSDPSVSDMKNYWILARQQEPSPLVLKKAHDVLDQNKLDKNIMTKTDQKNCPKLLPGY